MKGKMKTVERKHFLCKKVPFYINLLANFLDARQTKTFLQICLVFNILDISSLVMKLGGTVVKTLGLR